jgi:signal transduction histidine kinase
MSAARATWATVAWRAGVGGYALLTVAWLARGLTPGRGPSYPADVIALDYVFSIAMLALAAVLLRRSRHRWDARLLGLGMIGAAGAYNAQADVVNRAVAPLGAVVLHAGGTTAVVAGLLLAAGGSGRVFGWSAAVVAVCVGLVGGILADYAPSVDYLLAFGVLTPLAGSLRLPGSAVDRPERLTRSVAAALAALTTLVVAAACVTRGLGAPGLLGDVPGVSTAGPQPWRYPAGLAWLGPQVSAFWVSRAVAAAAFGMIVWSLTRRHASPIGPVVERTVRYAALVAVVGAAYVIGVVRIDAAFGLDQDWLAPPQVAAAALVALAFQPLRTLLARSADRLVYGRRITAAGMTARLATIARASAGGTVALRSLAQLTAQALGTEHAAVHVTLADGDELVCAWPDRTDPAPPGWRIPLVHHGSPVGALTIPVTPRALPRGRRRLVADLSRAAGVVVHNTATSLDLIRRREAAAARTAELRASRWRMVAAQDSERRDLERALHDVAQPGLTAVRLVLGLVNHQAETGNQKAYNAGLIRLRAQIQQADASLRRTLRGIDPPALTSSGVATALRETAESLGVDVRFTIPPGIEKIRFGKDVEAAAFYCCCEALQNCVKHSPDATVGLELRWDGSRQLLCFVVSDDGPGFDPTADGPLRRSGGLQNIADRLAAVDGDLVIDSAPGIGTRIAGTIPVPAKPPRPAVGILASVVPDRGSTAASGPSP